MGVPVLFTLPDGSEREVSADAGSNVMHVAVENGVPGIIGECGGDMSCASCHVYADSAGFRPVSNDEDDLLEAVDDRRSASRLGCQLVLREGMSRVDVEIPAS